jgi:hypothetical protein
MIAELRLEGKEIAALAAADAQLAQAMAVAGCPHCGGPLHRADFPRKPRGGLLWRAGETWQMRYGLCCGRRDCRRRQLPPSLRFLGRRVYLEVAVVLASACVQAAAAVKDASKVTGVPARTLLRWLRFWQEELPQRQEWAVLRAMFAPPPPDAEALPLSLLDRVAGELGESGGRVLWQVARLLAPLTTSRPDAARFLRDATAPPAG